MKELICRSCGAHNKETSKYCNLCGDTLNDEKEIAEKKELWKLFFITIFMSFCCVVVPGWILFSVGTLYVEEGLPLSVFLFYQDL